MQVFVVECNVKRATAINAPLLEREFNKSQVGGEMKIDGGLVLLQYQWGYGRDEPFPLHDPRRVGEVIDWTHTVLRVLFGHLEKQRNVLTVTAASRGEAGAAGEFTLALEKYLEDLLVEGWDSLVWTPPLQYLAHQVPCGYLGFIDILAEDRGTRDLVVIELKRDLTDDEVVGQLSRYMGWIAEYRAIPTGVSVRGIIVVHEVTPRLRAAALAHDNVQLYTYNVSIALHPVALPRRSRTL